MRAARPLLMTALVSLFFVEGQRALFASLFALGYEAVFPALRPGPAVAGSALLLLLLLAPLLPLARWLDRRRAVAAAAIGAAVVRLPMTHPALEARLLGGALVVAAAAVFLTWAVGYLDRRAVAGGVVTALVVDQLLRLAGSSYDVSLQPSWLPVQTLLSLALVAVVALWHRAGEEERGGDGLERRAGGIRRRGAIALGALFFLDLHVLGMPPVVARWAGVGHTFAGIAIGVAGAGALAAVLLLGRPTGGRVTTLLLVALAAAAAIIGYGADGTLVALVMAAGHLAALLLITRALDPSSGRRSGTAMAAGLAVFILATALYGLTFFAAFTVPALDGGVPWIMGAAGLVLAGCFVLLPRPDAFATPSSWVPAGLAIAAAAIATVVLAAPSGPSEAVVAEAGEVAGGDGDRGIRVATWNVHYGFDEAWRFDPGAMAETLRRADVDLVALHEVPVGAPTAYGVDLPLWLGRRAGLHHHFSATINGLLGDAFLTRLPGARVESLPLPAGGGDRKQLLRLTAAIGGDAVTFNALHLGVEERARSSQIREALAAVGPGPAVILGDLNAEPGSPVTTALAGAGFHDVFRDAGVAAPPTFPARQPTRRIDWIWIRGLRADSATVLSDTPSDHRGVVATLHILDGRIRSTDANDLQTP